MREMDRQPWKIDKVGTVYLSQTAKVFSTVKVNAPGYAASTFRKVTTQSIEYMMSQSDEYC